MISGPDIPAWCKAQEESILIQNILCSGGLIEGFNRVFNVYGFLPVT